MREWRVIWSGWLSWDWEDYELSLHRRPPFEWYLDLDGRFRG